MKKLLFLYTFVSVAICDMLEESYEKGFDYSTQDDEWILEIFMIIIGLLGVFFLFSVLHINRYTKKQTITKELLEDKKIQTMLVEKSEHEVDICMALNVHFSVLHRKASERNNTVFFIFDHKSPRNIKLNHTYISHIFFTLIEFMLDEFYETTIIADVVTLNISENEVKYRFLARANKLLPELQNGSINDIIKNKEKLLRYKKLDFISKVAKQLDLDVRFENMQRYSQFSFTQSFELSDNLPPIYKANLKHKKAVILEYDKNAYFILAQKLKKFGMSIFDCYDLDKIKQHLLNSIFSVDFVFVNTRLLRSLTKQELLELEQSKIKHHFKLILISDNEKYDNVADNIDHDCFLKRPFNMDAFLAGVTPPPTTNYKQPLKTKN